MKSPKVLLKFFTLILFSLLLTACQKSDAGVFHLFMAILGYALLGYISYKISDFLVSNIDEEVSYEPDRYESRFDRLAAKSLGKAFSLTQRFGIWMERVSPLLSKQVPFNRIWFVFDAVFVVLCIVFLFVGVYVKDCLPYYFGGLVWLFVSIYVFCLTVIYNEPSEGVKPLKVGSFISFTILYTLILVLVLIVVFCIIVMACSNSNSIGNNSSSEDADGDSIINDDSSESNRNGTKELESRKEPYGVHFRYPSGSATEVGSWTVYFDHTPTVAEIKSQMRESSTWAQDTLNKMDIYCLLKGGIGNGNVTESHPRNLLR